jgi:hypothetical protein
LAYISKINTNYNTAKVLFFLVLYGKVLQKVLENYD